MAIPTISQLQNELISLVQQVPAFTSSGFSIFSLEDLSQKSALQTLPIAGVGYDGAEPVGNTATSTDARAHSVSLVTLQFLVVIAVQYQYTGQDDNKSQATDLLGEIRQRVLGYRGVNTRPWVFVVERPEPDASGDGLVFYSQVWRTSLPVIGNFNNA